MKTLNEWKFEIAFNNAKYIDAKNYTLYLKGKEKQVMDIQLEFYRTHFSFDQLIQKMRVVDDNKRHILMVVASRYVMNILHTPYMLKQHYLKIINDEFPKYKKVLVIMLNYSIQKTSPKNPITHIYKAVFGKYLPKIKRKIDKYSKRKLQFVPLSQKLTEFDYLREVRNLERQMFNDKASQGIFGRYSLYNTTYNYNNLFGLGEYTFGKTTHGGDDLFVINSNNYTLNINQLHHMTYLNLYPGKGHFVNTLYSKTRTTCFDTGSTYLVNGWATFAMWHYNQNTYTRNLKVIAGNIGKAFFAHNLEKASAKVYNYLLGIMPKDAATNYLIYMTQYPGLLESYIFGAIATEETINQGFASSPLGLLDEYKRVNLGDFFFEYRK